jgi:hypothetical protein
MIADHAHIGTKLAVAVFVAFTLGATPSFARGLCNIDSVLPLPERKPVMEAATSLYSAGKSTMETLAAFERDDRDTGAKIAGDAISAFNTAAGSYEKLSQTLSIDLSGLKSVDPAIIAKEARAARTLMFEQLAAYAKEGDAKRLLAECGQAARKMAVAMEVFRKEVSGDPNQEAPYTNLLAEFGGFLYVGRTISVMFKLNKSSK